MNQKRIAITGVGGGVGQSIIKSLYDSEYQIIGLDGEPLAAGLYAVPKAYRIPYAKSRDFIPSILEICKNEHCDLLFPGLDAELKELSLNRDKFEKIGTKVIVSDPQVIDIADNKLLTYQRLNEFGLKVPLTFDLQVYLDNSSILDFPIIIKQKHGGARSKNVFLIESENNLSRFLAQYKDSESFIAQEYIDGDEFTCGSVNLSGICFGVIVMRRQLRDGDTYKCFVEENPLIEEEIKLLMQFLKPFGACNIQLRLKNNIPYIFEINARCSGTTASRTLCGFNEPKMIADFLIRGIQPHFNIKKLTVLRYWKEVIVNDQLIEELKTQGTILNGSYFRL